MLSGVKFSDKGWQQERLIVKSDNEKPYSDNNVIAIAKIAKCIQDSGITKKGLMGIFKHE